MARPLRTTSRRSSGDAPSTLLALIPFILAGLLAAAAVAVGGVLALRSFADQKAKDDATERTQFLGRAVVEPALTTAVTQGLEAGAPETLADFEDLVQERILDSDLALGSQSLVRIKLWNAKGKILYSDATGLVGRSYGLGAEKTAALESAEAHAELSTLDGPENIFDRDLGTLMEVYFPVRTQTSTGEQLIFETYHRYDIIKASAGDVWKPFLPWLIGSLMVLWLIQLPIAWSMARSLRARQAEREVLMERSLDASNVERRRIAADLHDGPVQELAGLSYQLVAAAERGDRSEPELREALRTAAGNTRTVMRKLRALLVDIHPPNLQSEGLAAAVADLVAPMASAGVAVTSEVPPDLRLSPDAEALLFRGTQEALRNVQKHAAATEATVGVMRQNGTVRLTVRDNGRGFSPAQRDQSREGGHMGLTLLEELAAQQGGSVSVSSTPGAGTTFVLEVPSS